MATKHLGLVIYGCAVAAILRSQGVSSAPVHGEAASVRANQIADLEQQLMQQSGENKSSQPSSVDQGEVPGVDPQDAQTDDALLADDAEEATGLLLSSDYYGLPSSDEGTQPKQRLNNHLGEDSNEGNPAAAAAAAEEEEDANSDEKQLDEQMYNGRHQEGYSINLGERSFEDAAAEEIENEENNRAIRNEDDVEQVERPWEEVSDFESQESARSGVASEKTIVDEGDAQQEKTKEEEMKEQQPKAEEEDEQKTRDDRKKLEQQRYIEDGQDNTAKTFDSRLLISREKKTLQGRWLAAELDKSNRHKDGHERLRYVDDDFTGYM